MTKNSIHKNYPSLTGFCHHLLVEEMPNGLNAKTNLTRAGFEYQTAMSELSRQRGHKWGADNLLPFMDMLESDAPLEFLADERGGVFVKLPMIMPESKSMTLQLASTVKECSEAAALAAAHIIDGKVTKAEFRSFKKENREAIAALLALEYLMEQAAEPCGQEGE